MPTMKMKVLPKFPARVLAGAGITITNQNGTYTFSLDPGTPLATGQPNSTANSVAVFADTSGKSLDDSSATISSGGTLDINPTPSSTNQGINITQTSPSTGSTVGPLIFNLIDVTNQANVTDDGSGIFSPPDPLNSRAARGLEVRMTSGGANLKGFQEAMVVQMLHTLDNSAIDGADHIALVTMAYSNKNATSWGLYSINANAFIDNGGFHNHLVGLNSEVGIFTGGSANYRSGLRLQSWGDGQAAISDSAIEVWASTGEVPWKNFVTFSDFAEAQSIDSTGDLFRTSQAFTVANVFNLPTLTVTGNILSFPHVTMTGAGVLTLNRALTAAPSPVGGNSLHLVNNGTTQVTIDSVTTDAGINFRRANTGLSAPSGLVANDLIGALNFLGYGATQYASSSAASIFGIAHENWTDAAHGAVLDFATTPNGSTTRATRMRLEGAGGLAIGSITPVNTNVLLQANRNTAALPTPIANTVVHAGNADGTSTYFTLDAFAGEGGLFFRRGDGTNAAKGAVQNGEVLGVVGGLGYGTTGYSAASRSAIIMRAAQNWTDANQGADIDFRTTTNGTSTLTSRMVIQASGGISIGTSTDPGIGKLLALNGLQAGAAGAIVGTLALFNATSGSITVQPVAGALGSAVLSLPAATDTLVGKATTDTLTNKTFDTAGAGNSFSINGAAVTANTGSGAVARATSPVFTTPSIGVAVGASLGLGTTTALNSGVLSQLNSNSGALPAPLTGSLLHAASADSTATRIMLDSFAAAGALNVRRANGTNASRFAIASGDFIGAHSFVGYGASQYHTDGAFFGGRATEAFTNTASGMSIEFWTVPNTTAVSARAFIIDQDKSISALGSSKALTGTAIPAGGTAGAGFMFSSTANFGVFFGSGAPTLSAAKGSLYLRSDGSATNNRAYINTDGGTTWTALTTAA